MFIRQNVLQADRFCWEICTNLLYYYAGRASKPHRMTNISTRGLCITESTVDEDNGVVVQIPYEEKKIGGDNLDRVGPVKYAGLINQDKDIHVLKCSSQ